MDRLFVHARFYTSYSCRYVYSMLRGVPLIRLTAAPEKRNVNYSITRDNICRYANTCKHTYKNTFHRSNKKEVVNLLKLYRIVMGNERVCQISDFQLVGKWVKFRLENSTQLNLTPT